MADSKQYTFNPIEGMTLLAYLVTGVGFPAGAVRVRVNMARMLQAMLAALANAEAMAMVALSTDPSQVINPLAPGLVLGQRAAEIKAKSKANPGGNAYVDAYIATQAVARWFPEAICNPREKDPELFTPSTPLIQPARTILTGVSLLTVGAVGVAAAAAAGLAWWADKRMDAQASVEVEAIRTLAAADLAQRIAQQQIAAGQPIDPSIAGIFKDLGQKKEEARGWGVPLAAVGSAGLVIGAGTVIAVKAS